MIKKNLMQIFRKLASWIEQLYLLLIGTGLLKDWGYLDFVRAVLITRA